MEIHIGRLNRYRMPGHLFPVDCQQDVKQFPVSGRVKQLPPVMGQGKGNIGMGKRQPAQYIRNMAHFGIDRFQIFQTGGRVVKQVSDNHIRPAGARSFTDGNGLFALNGHLCGKRGWIMSRN